MSNESLLGQVARLISTIGVPAAIAFFVLWRLESSIDDLTRVVWEGNQQTSALVTELAFSCGRGRGR